MGHVKASRLEAGAFSMSECRTVLPTSEFTRSGSGISWAEHLNDSRAINFVLDEDPVNGTAE
jgi:hypothetical protein